MLSVSSGGEQGDLYVFVRVKDHSDLRREGLTVHSDVSVSFVDAILGEPAAMLLRITSCLPVCTTLPIGHSENKTQTNRKLKEVH